MTWKRQSGVKARCRKAVSPAGGPALSLANDPQLLYFELEGRAFHAELRGSAEWAAEHPAACQQRLSESCKLLSGLHVIYAVEMNR